MGKRRGSENRGKRCLRGTYVPISGGLGDLRAGQLILELRLQPFPLSPWYPPFLTEPLRLESDIIGVGKSLGPTTESPDENQVRQGVLDPVHRPKRRQ